MTERISNAASAISGSTQMTRFNALRHGVLSRYTILPWEDGQEYRSVLDALVAEHRPDGPTEEHLVEELAGILWRKRRLRLAEMAAYQNGLAKTLAPHRETAKAALAHLDASTPERVVDAVRTSDQNTAVERADIAADEATTRKALKILDSDSSDAYEAALSALRGDTREWWADTLAADPNEEGEAAYAADAPGLRRFIEGEVLTWFADRTRELEHRPLIREQAFGEALYPDKLDRLGRYEIHLDRKFERMLGMLLKLRQLRQPALPA